MRYELRAPVPDDIDAVAAVLAAADPRSPLDAEFVRDEWSRPALDLDADAWVAVAADGAVAGYGQVVREGTGVVESWGVVHPNHRGRGIGAALLTRIEARAAELGPARFRHGISGGDEVAAGLLRARGLRPVRHFWHMQIELDPRPGRAPAPDGIAIEPPDDLRAVHAVLDVAFAGDWGYRPEPFDAWVAEQESSPSHDPALWLLARDGGEPVGALTANVWGHRGWVNELGVLPSHRGRGIAAALLARAFTTFADRGCREALLSVDSENPTGATALYERAGMRTVWRWEQWER